MASHLFNTRASCFVRVSRQLETIKAFGLQVSGYPDEALALVFDIIIT